MICVCESEVILYHLHLYARRAFPGIPFHPEALRRALDGAGIARMQQLFALAPHQRRAMAVRVLEGLPASARWGLSAAA